MFSSSSVETATYFEDLSNELVFEIFEFLDYLHAYEAFFNLNQRFRSLITDSNLPIRIHTGFVSKSSYERYYNDVIVINKHRITALSLSNPFIYGIASSPIHIIHELVKLERLTMENIQPKYLEKVLPLLVSLPALASLHISTVDRVINKNTIYNYVFRMRSLKYCNLSLGSWGYSDIPIAFGTDYSTSIKYLVINDTIRSDKLNDLLACVPDVQRLSIHVQGNELTQSIVKKPLGLNALTDVSLQLHDCMFRELEELIIAFFSKITVLRISVTYDFNSRFMNAKEWERVISCHMPNLRVFDLRHEDWSCRNSINANSNNINVLTPADLFHQFASSFWTERQWFFTLQNNSTTYGKSSIFHSTDPYRYR